ncbi:MAG: histidine kinase, partial [Oscillospiraceae bacterium]|nr:histidine kinase [Oscillospiraceae bacterium]
SGFTYVTFSPLSQIQGATARITRITVLYVVESVLVLLFCILLVYYYFFRPIRLLANGMQRFEKGDFSIRMKENRSDEIGYINMRFNKMAENINTLINENYVNELVKRDIQLKFTQNQINEHFLYNTLDSIHWLANKHNTPDIGGMIKALAHFYRTNLSNGRDSITLGEVAEMIGAYLYLQGIRFGDALRYTIDFDEELKSVSVPKHLFLPLVENAAGHGIRGKPDGEITVSLAKSENGIRFSVTDNGRGIEKERMDEILSHLNSREININDSFALRNINTQLELYFGNTDGIHICTEQGKGTTVWFEVSVDSGQ